MALITLALALPLEQGSIRVSLKAEGEQEQGESRMGVELGMGREHEGLQYILGLPINRQRSQV